MIYESAAELIITAWKKAYRRKPKLTVIATIVLLLGGGIAIYFGDKSNREKQERARLENLSYEIQVTQLNQTEENIKNLLSFIAEQRTKLKESEDVLNSLKSEQEKLKPIVETDRQVINAIFEAQERKTSASVWRERWIGFGFGVVSSLVASLIWYMTALIYRKRFARSTTSNA